MKTIFKRIKNMLFPPSPETMEERCSRYRSYGVTIGKDCSIFATIGNGRDACLLSFGDNVTVAYGTTFLMHDNAIIKPTHGQYTDILGKVTVGNNCFIGAGCIILAGVSIADGVIIGAGSVVTKSIKDVNTVYAGNPAKFICTVDEYVQKNEGHMFNLNHMTKEETEALLKANEDKLLVR